MKYRVRFYRHVTTVDRHEITIEADSPEEARKRVNQWGKGEIELTDEECSTENLIKEGEVISSEFDELEEEDHPYAVTPVREDT